MTIPFIKAHGARNDFLLSWLGDVPEGDQRAMAIAICDRNTGVGADGWILVAPGASEQSHGAIRLYNSDGSDSEISGNGTRCAAAMLIDAGIATNDVRITTGAGTKYLRLLQRDGDRYQLEMNMGRANLAPGNLYYQLQLEDDMHEVTILNVGNPQCVLFTGNFDFDWRDLGRRIEWHPHFPKRTNVSFVKVRDRHNLDVLFWERGAGETASSGTGSMGAAAAAVVRGLAESPLTVNTSAGPLSLEWKGDDIFLTGPSQIVVRGNFFG
ncbi:MAG: diaminopimelate epimerase [Acidobacteria bacterium]|nr:diaminopimelate epimerase [Acidobacteriota bacterium]